MLYVTEIYRLSIQISEISIPVQKYHENRLVGDVGITTFVFVH